uniref:TIR domain-containing protein n=1 Tax=Fagus sylvatica TaxID=28930 RepID=A0A2N9J8B4_FAGSY
MASSSTLRSLSSPPRYDAFLSFRGLETRHAFTGHLYKALKYENIDVFRDDKELRRGGVIKLELNKAIKASQYAIIVLSENYADSEWCLNELAEIMECRENMGLTVLPVFYHVKPSHVREQKGTFVIDRDEYENISAEMKQKWKKALKDVGDIAGFECKRESHETEVIQQIIERLHDDELKLVKRSSNLLVSCEVPGPPDFTVGMDVHLKVLKTQLLNKNKNKKQQQQQLLLTAPAGCGKTTLVTMLGHDKEIKGKFKDKIFYVPVSNTLNLTAIVHRLYLYIKGRVPNFNFESDDDAMHQLWQLLKPYESDPILLILDDVCSGSEYRLQKFKFDMPNYNILVTSRTTIPGFSFVYDLKPLNDEDAMTLFHRSAFLQDGSSHIPVEDIKKIVRSCGGFPLALEVIGISLKEEPVEVWQSRARKWSNGHSILNSSSDLRDCLRRSLEFSDDKVTLKDYFMDLGSFPEDHRIPVPALIDMWAELYGLDEVGIEVIAKLHELTAQKLANLVRTRKDASEIKRYYNEDFVTQHKILRELAINESSQGPVGQRQKMIMEISDKSPTSTKQKKQLINARLLSISKDELFSSRWCNIQAPKVEVLVLNLTYKDLQLTCVCGEYGRTQGQTFGDPTLKVSDALPNLMEINIDYCNDLVELSAGLCEVILLKTLSITNCHKLSALPKGIEMLVNLEVLRLRSCTDLSELPDSIRSLHKLRILDISDCLSIRTLAKIHWAKLWEPIKEVLTNLEVKVAEKDINLSWLQS